MSRVGRIVSAWRYPVKSMAGEQLHEAPVTLQGIQADRMYAFVQAESPSPFPWLTGRELPGMMRHQPVWADGDRPKLSVQTPEGAEHPIESAELRDHLAEASSRPVYLLPNYRGSFDVAAITLMSTATVDRVAEASDTPADPLRFRMNFYVELDDPQPWAEDAWVGQTVKIGDAVRVAVTERDKRCAMITLAPHGGDPLTSVLTAVANENDATAGVYGSVLTPGIVREGDEVTIEA
jgi:MOSC domain-containing protein